MKDYIKPKLKHASSYAEVKAIIDDYMDYYNNERYQWHLAESPPSQGLSDLLVEQLNKEDKK